MGLCVLYYVEYSLFNVKKVGFFYLGWNYTLIMGQIEPEGLELFALEFGKIAKYDFVYTISSTNINQSAPTLVKMYVTIRSRISSITDLIGPELPELSALELQNLPYLTLFTL